MPHKVQRSCNTSQSRAIHAESCSNTFMLNACCIRAGAARWVIKPSPALRLATNWLTLVAGAVNCQGRCWGSTLRFSIFVSLVTHHLPEGTTPYRLHPPSPARIDENPSLDPGSDCMDRTRLASLCRLR